MSMFERFFGRRVVPDAPQEPDYDQDQCYGCGGAVKPQPVCAVVKDAESGRFVAKPVCDNCHQFPEHRKRVIKGTYFYWQDVERAVAKAGSSSIHG